MSNFSQNLTELPDHLSYSLRYPGELRRVGQAMNPLWFNWRTDFFFPQFQPGGARNWASDHDGTPAGYYLEGFLFMQNFIFRAFMQLKNSLNIDLTTVPTVRIQVRLAIDMSRVAKLKKLSLFTEISLPTVRVRRSPSRTSDFGFTFHPSELRLSLHQHHQVHHHREGEATQRGNENYGIR
jgi:hypothetical protein